MRNLQKIFFLLLPTVLISVVMVYFTVNQAQTEAYAAPSGSKNSSVDQYKAMEIFYSVMERIGKDYVEPIDTNKAVEGAIKGMLSELDPHSSYFTADEFRSFQEGTSGAFGGLGIVISLRNDAITIMSALEDTPAWKAGIKAGDIIAVINETPTDNMSLEEAVKLMRGKAGSKVKLTIIRKNELKPLEFKLTRSIIKVKSVKYAMIDKNLGYIRLSQFQDKSSDEMINAMKALKKEGAKGFILDLRGNSGGILDEAVQISSIFLPNQKTVVFTRDREKKEQHYMTSNAAIKDLNSPIVVLVNEYSASASEIVAGALQDYKRAIIIGKTTFGKGSVQSVIKLQDGSAIKLTTSRYYTPLERSIQGVGIIPDVEVEPGKIEYVSDYLVIKEKDLSGHLKGENEKSSEQKVDRKAKKSSDEVDEAIKNANRILPSDEDLQYISAIQLLKGMMVYGDRSTKQ